MTQTVQLGDVAEKIAMGPFGSNIKVSTFVESGIPIISGQHLKGIAVDDSEGYNFVSTEHADKLQNSNVFRGDVVFTHAGNIGQVAYIPKNSKYDRYVLSQRQFYLRPSEELSAEYLTYYFKSPKGQSQLLEFANQTGVPSLSQPATNLKKIKIELPNLETQKKIADILGTIDEKIELNRKMNETLEQMGQALFRHYFIDNPEAEEWEDGTLSRLAEVNRESVGKDYLHDEIKYIDISSVSTGSIDKYDMVDLASAPSRARRIVRHGDIIWATVRPNRRAYSLIMNPTDNTIVSTGFAVLSPKENALGFVYYHTSAQAFTDYLTLHARGAAYPAVTATDFKNAPIKIPDADTLRQFNERILPNMQTIGELKKQIQTLTTLRDALLPRLISGKVKV